MTRKNDNKDNFELSDEELQKIVAEADTGGRKPTGLTANVLLVVALAWSLFQLWIASPLPFSLGVFVFNDTEARAIHLAFAVFLAFAAYPALKRSPRDRVPIQDWILAGAGAYCAAYLFLFYRELSTRPGLPTDMDIATAVVGLTLLLEAARRALGLPMVILAVVFLCYIFFGPYMPDVIAHRGASLAKGMSHMWLTTEGVFGVALGVSTSFIFLFVLFGALLETAGAGAYFIKSAIALLGHMRGGPAKAAVVASASTGLISGSSIANVVTTGTFTIPLMKSVGYRADKAASVEVASSVNGQIMPPVMGAAAFLMVEYVGITYVQVMKHAILPALISYIALFYIVHLEALKMDLKGLPRREPLPWQKAVITTLMTFSGLVILSAVIYWGFGWIKDLFGDGAFIVVGVLMLIAYIFIVRHGAKYPELHLEKPGETMEYLPEIGPTLKSGLHFLLPVAALIWNLMVEQLSPALSAFWATLFLMFILVTQRPLFALFRGTGALGAATRQGFHDLLSGLVTGARNMIGIGIATATAGVIVGTVTLTGIGLAMTELVEVLSGGNLMIMLVLVAVICLILGMGLPTTANYIVVSSLMAPVIVELGAQSGLLVPLIAVHLFVFYFGLMADVTPPVGLASYAAAGIAKSDPIRTGLTAFGYSLRTAVLPFMFIFNTQLLLIGIDSSFQLVLTIVTATVASMMFAAATQGFFIARNRIHETILLLLVTFTLFRPGFWMDMLYPPYDEVAPTELSRLVEEAPRNGKLRIWIEGMSLEGRDISKGVLLPLGERGPARERLNAMGLTVMSLGDDVQIAAVRFGSQAEKLGLEQGFTITTIELPSGERPAKEWMFVPAFVLLGLVYAMQKPRQRRRETEAEA
ncbi:MULTISPECIES: TRAP transporter permease [unclassified Thauera]|uniref:TRAP transporter permease n=1 Tax=unclassified Thauera TaxID=2609274 RepID=UPI0002CDC485|nr:MULTISPECIES: TRAP transporter permease [unclassified Thauera]ENO91644.1 TRAP transporter 4TM/12TM fusion protein [Thauera sp. 28]HAY10512.1 TRAP transporter permease DctM/Q [Thauera sp.]